jgi:hypothetical protein
MMVECVAQTLQLGDRDGVQAVIAATTSVSSTQNTSARQPEPIL